MATRGKGTLSQNMLLNIRGNQKKYNRILTVSENYCVIVEGRRLSTFFSLPKLEVLSTASIQGMPPLGHSLVFRADTLYTHMFMDDENLRVLTLNTWKGDGDYDWRRQLMARELYTLMPEIICLQEAVRSEDYQIDTAEYLADFLNMEMVYAPARKKMRVIDSYTFSCFSGLAILSALPIDSHHISSLITDEKDPDRVALTAQLVCDKGLLTITNVHLTHLPGQDQLRLAQLQSAITGNRTTASENLWLCCGDCNLHIDEGLRRLLSSLCGLSITDCYLEGGGLLPGATLVDSAPADAQKRIDHILLLQKHKNSRVQCTNARVVLDEADFEGCYPSDHFGVCVDITVPGRV